MKKPSARNPYISKGVPGFAQDTTVARSGYHAQQGTLSANESKKEKAQSKITPSRNNFQSARAQLIANLKAKGVPASTNWRTSAIPISHRNRPR